MIEKQVVEKARLYYLRLTIPTFKSLMISQITPGRNTSILNLDSTSPITGVAVTLPEMSLMSNEVCR